MFTMKYISYLKFVSKRIRCSKKGGKMILEKFRIDGKIALITGGTRGIGLAIAHALGEAGAKLVVTSRTDKFGGLESLKKANYDVSFFESDMHDKTVPQKIIDYVLDKHKRIDILVNNAGVAKHGEMEEYNDCLLYTSPSPRDRTRSRMPSSA